MSDANPGGGQQLPPPSDPLGRFMKSPQLVYVLFLAGFVLAILPLIGLVLAYVNREGASELDRSHYDFQIATFWRGLLILAVGIVTVFIVVGWVIILLWALWAIIRNVKGLSAFSRGQSMPANVGWGFG